jgi:hypothetical protein
MPEMEQFSNLIGDIYDASLNPALWSEVLDKVCTFVGGKVAGVVSQDAVGRNVSFHLVSTHDSHYRQLYEEKYFKLNPVFPMILFSQIEQTLTIPDVLPDSVRPRMAGTTGIHRRAFHHGGKIVNRVRDLQRDPARPSGTVRR